MSEWISVEDRLPEDEESVLCFGECPLSSNVVFAGYLLRGSMEWFSHCSDNDSDYDKANVTHWMPLPEPPEINDE